MDESDYYAWATDSNRPVSYRSLYESRFDTEWSGIPGVRDEGFWKQYGTGKTNVNSSQDPIYSYDGDLNSGLKYNGRLAPNLKSSMKFKLIGVDPDGNLRQNYTTEDIWQTMTREEMEEQIDRSLVEVEFSAGDGKRQNDITADFVQFTDKFVSATLPEQMQSIPGYFDFQGVNAEKRLPDVVSMKTKAGGSSFDKPVIIQSDGELSGYTEITNYSGSSAGSQAGIINRVFDITELFKAHYNTRIERRYYCKAGKTLAEVSKTVFGPPQWEGVGKWEKEEAARKWNSQETGDYFVGYLLNDDYSFPKLEADRSVPGIPAEGEQYALAPAGIQLLCTFLLPFTIKAENCRYWISENGAETEVKALPSGKRITTAEAAVELLREMFGAGYEYTVVSSSACLVEKKNGASSDTLEIKACQGSCYGYFSIPTGNISGIQDRTVGVTSFASGYHPAGLSKALSWITNSYVFETQSVVFDLCRAPLEASERDYRYQAPTVNCASCICPNVDCLTAGKTAGMYAEMKGLAFGDGQTACPACGADLSGEAGTVRKNGDGLYSWYYQEAFADDPFITGIEAAVEAGTSFRVSCRNSVSATWSSLLNVVYDEASRQYTCCLNGREEHVKTLPGRFSLDEKHWVRARYVQLEVDPVKNIEKLEYLRPEKLNEYSLKVSGNFREMGLFDWSGLKCEVVYSAPDADGGEATETESRILSTVNLSDDGTELTFYVRTGFDGREVEKLVVRPNRYTSRVGKFRVFGFHYKPSELTMTGGAQEKYHLFSVKKSAYQLDEFPSQILAVSIGKNDSGGIVLQETGNRESLNYQLAVREVPVLNAKGEHENKKVYVIRSGNYFFDPVHNRICLPVSGTCDGRTVVLKEFEAQIAGIKENISFYPTRMSVRYWTGSGEPVTLEAQAEQLGPSYQVEKDTITVIEDMEMLPDNGMSAKLPDMAGNIAARPIPWVCYNHIPATLDYSMQAISGGYFLPPELKSTTLGQTVDNDKFFVDQFGENLRYIRGRCKTEVTFYGAPEQILSGTIRVKAPAYTTKVINTGSGSVVTRERTGGIKDGCLVFKLGVKECKGRKTLAWNKPTIIVYAKERNPTDEF